MKKQNEKTEYNVMDVETGASRFWSESKSECDEWLRDEARLARKNNRQYNYSAGEEYKDEYNHYIIRQDQ